MATEVPKEYVRQQLKSMGLHEISEQELESYTRDFSRLIQEHIQHDSTSTSDLSSLSDTAHAHHASLTSSSLSSLEHTPLNTHQLPPPGSAVFKTFPGDKENRVQLLSPSLSPNSILLSPDRNNVSMSSNVGSKVKDKPGNRRQVKRKVLRKCNGESRVFDESFSGSVLSSPLDDRGVAREMSQLSLTSVSSSEANVHMSMNSDQPGGRVHCCKSFIRPLSSHPHLRGLKRCDPVQRYHEFHKLWEAHKPPGEKSRTKLRWHIREQLQQDVPYFEPPRRALKVNEFVVPTEKKRSALRWEIRHKLAHQ